MIETTLGRKRSSTRKQLLADEHAMAEYETEARLLREKTARLRALRLARDAGVKPAAADTVLD
jgi:hypothetical protein